MSVKVSVQGESSKARIICGCLTASRWLEMIATIQIAMCMVQLVIVSCTPHDWPDEKSHTGNETTTGILPHLRPWTNGHTKGLRVCSVIFSFISLLMSALLIRAVTKRLLDILNIWIVWVIFKIAISWSSSSSFYYLNWFLIVLLLGQTELNLFVMFLIITLRREIMLEQQLQGSQKCCEELREF